MPTLEIYYHLTLRGHNFPLALCTALGPYVRSGDNDLIPWISPILGKTARIAIPNAFLALTYELRRTPILAIAIPGKETIPEISYSRF